MRKRSVGDLRRNGPLTTLIPKVKKLKYSLKVIPLNSGGYTSRGEYYGRGGTLYEAYNEATDESLIFRAADRESAKRMLENALNGTAVLSYGDSLNPDSIELFKNGRPKYGSKEWDEWYK